MGLNLTPETLGSRMLWKHDNTIIQDVDLNSTPKALILDEDRQDGRKVLQVINSSTTHIYLAFKEQYEVDDENVFSLAPYEHVTFDTRFSVESPFAPVVYARTEEFETTIKVLEVF